MFSPAFVTPATPRTPAGGRACGTSSPMGGCLIFRPCLIRQCPRIRAIFAAYVRNFYWKSPQKMPCAGSSGAERTAREKKGADHRHRPSARRWPEYVRRGTEGASHCTNGPNNGLRLYDSEIGSNGPRARFRAVASSRRPRHRPRDIKCHLKHPNGRPGGCGREIKWVWRSGMHQKTGLVRASTWGWSSWKWQTRTPARLCSL